MCEGLPGDAVRAQATLLGKIKRDVEDLLKLALENYYLLSRWVRGAGSRGGPGRRGEGGDNAPS